MVGAAPVVRTVTPECSPGTHTGYVDGRPYQVYIPQHATKPGPTIVSFHGRLQKAKSQIDILKPLADAHGVIIVAPQARAGKWDFRGSDTRFTGRILDNLTCDNPARTYASGMSMGSAMTFLQACANPRRFAAFAGASFEIYMPKCADPSPVPLVAFHGTADRIVPFMGGLTASTATAPPARATMRKWARRDGCRRYVREVYVPGVSLQTWDQCDAGVKVQFYTLHGGNHQWPTGRVNAAEVMWEFFSQYRL
jgi:polyhydroxybutyrate depolymerase